jgi:hypothetical protein
VRFRKVSFFEGLFPKNIVSFASEVIVAVMDLKVLTKNIKDYIGVQSLHMNLDLGF